MTSDFLFSIRLISCIWRVPFNLWMNMETSRNQVAFSLFFFVLIFILLLISLYWSESQQLNAFASICWYYRDGNDQTYIPLRNIFVYGHLFPSIIAKLCIYISIIWTKHTLYIVEYSTTSGYSVYLMLTFNKINRTHNNNKSKKNCIRTGFQVTYNNRVVPHCDGTL